MAKRKLVPSGLKEIFAETENETMNIRTLANPITPVDSMTKVERKDVAMGNSDQDRDADGRRHHEEQDQSPLSEQELAQALEYLKNLDGLKNNGLQFKVEVASAVRVILITDVDGKVVRRIPEYEMRALIGENSVGRGRIFNKAG